MGADPVTQTMRGLTQRVAVMKRMWKLLPRPVSHSGSFACRLKDNATPTGMKWRMAISPTRVPGADSALIIELMGEILEEVYQSPARLAGVQQAVANRQQGGAQRQTVLR